MHQVPAASEGQYDWHAIPAASEVQHVWPNVPESGGFVRLPETQQVVFAKPIKAFGQSRTLVCDAKCPKAWGHNGRARVEFDPEEPDDHMLLPDNEVGEAPACSGIWEGGHGKPRSLSSMGNKWCYRECERSYALDPGEPFKLYDFNKGLYNMPGRHPQD